MGLPRRYGFAALALLLGACGPGTTPTPEPDMAGVVPGPDLSAGGGGCGDGKQDGDETDVDCGGSCMTKCAAGKMCLRGTDCAAGSCLNNVCVTPMTCGNGKKDGDETDLDCGGTCNKCPDGKMCLRGSDCTSGSCLNNICIPQSNPCMNGMKDGQETDVDCGGGMCPQCATGKGCLRGSDCQSAMCLNNVCAPGVSPCANNMKDGQETDVDCGGGTCGACANGKMCLRGTDCLSAMCLNNICAPGVSPCMNGVKDGQETDIDCGGGTCGKCANGKMCLFGTDCTSGMCLNNVCSPGVNPCANGVKDGQETDVDCGGNTCGKCANGKMCLFGTDCQSTMCLNNVCSVGPTCVDNIKNGQETDVDCGGPTCGKCGNGKACLAGSDCQSGQCSNKICIVGASCTNQVKDGNETDIDCGGGLCPACPNGKVCRVGTDCQSNTCTNGVCSTPPNFCMDGQKNNLETDIDCGGGTCPACANGKACKVGTDCQSNTCTNGVCSTPPNFCMDGQKNNLETDIDCGGGTCPLCVNGKACLVNGDCQSGACIGNRCGVAPTCNDGVKNGNETDIDCGGGTCAKCANGKACLVVNDCASGVCTGGVCVNPANCMDGVKNGNETDIDCGGTCPNKCANGKGCAANADCQSALCQANVCTVAASCNDGLKNGNETDIDCGGTCPNKCVNGKACNVNGDCQSGLCSLNVCLAPPANCMDGVKNGNETDIDCGGGTCGKCADGKACKAAADCTSSICTNFTCAVPACNDGVKNGKETDVDCGGGTCPKCVVGKGCTAGSDCTSNMCTNGLCSTPSSCNDAVKNGAETDIDCGGGTCPRCGTNAACMVGTDCVSNACSGAKCTSLFAAPSPNTVPNYPQGLFAFDMDGDGKRDVVVASLYADKVSVLWGAGNGTFSAAASFVASGGPSSVAYGDFNSDGKVDIASATYSTNINMGAMTGVSVLLGSGGRLYANEILAVTNGNPQDVAVADVNGNGTFDIVSADYPNNRVNVMLGMGNGTFAGPAQFAVGTNPYSLVVRDLSGDGQLDIITANYMGNNISVLYGNGNGTFQNAINYNVGMRPKSVTVADFNGDGKLDVATANVNTSDVSVLLNTGGGVLGAAVQYAGAQWNLSISPRAITAADVTNDGKTDILCAAYNQSALLLYRGLGDGTFLAPLSYPAGANPAGVVVADFNNDTKPDIAVSNPTTNQVNILTNMSQ